VRPQKYEKEREKQTNFRPTLDENYNAITWEVSLKYTSLQTYF